jgi:hypothetical protein
MLISDEGRIARRTIEPLGSFRCPREKVRLHEPAPAVRAPLPPRSAHILFDADGVAVPGYKTAVPACGIN